MSLLVTRSLKGTGIIKIPTLFFPFKALYIVVILKLITMGLFKVKKKSGKPFKSGLKENTVKDVIESPYVRGKKVYRFEEDDSMVSVDVCEKIEEGS